jgi:hypothetical protein
MPFQIQGTGGVVAEVEANTKALRVTPRPIDIGSLGSFSLGMTSGTMAAALGANTDIFQARYNGSGLALVTRVMISAGNAGTGFTAGIGTFALYGARGFTVNGTGGTAATLTGDNNALRTSFAATGMADIRISSTAALGAGTKTLDATAFHLVPFPLPATAGTPMLYRHMLFEALPGEHPIVLAPNEGIAIQNVAIAATGTWTFSVAMSWDEVASY